jgi:DNA/RNA endonuclease YhcR with UshA esterase domain
MKRFLLPVFFLFTIVGLNAQLVISEIMYNPPESGTDSLEYIEIYNAGTAVNLDGYYFAQGVTYTFPSYMLMSGEYVVVAVDSLAMLNNFGITALQWTSGGLSNGGEDIIINDPTDAMVDIVDFDDANGWPEDAADGGGSSIVLCDLGADNNDPANWQAATTDSGVDINGNDLRGNPGAASDCQSDFLVRFIATEAFVDESVGSVQLGVEYPAGDLVPYEVSVTLNSGNSTATVDMDFTWSDTTSMLSGFGTDTMYLTVPIIDDMVAENTEEIVLELSAVNIDVDVLANTFSITIEDNDVPIAAYPIGVVTSTDADGVVDSLGVECQIQGVVYGVNMRPSGLQFTIIDSNGDGIGMFNGTGDFGYTVNEGDEVIVQGSIAQFNGLTQINPDTVWMVSAGNTLVDPPVVTALDESTESQLIKIENLTIVDPDDWTGSGSGFNVDVTDGTNTYTMRVDADVDLYGTAAPAGPFNLTGLGGQFDSSSPYLSGYQILPRYMADIEAVTEFDPNYPPYDIGVVTTVDADGVVDSVGVACQLQGVVYGVNQRPGGLQMTVIDGNNDGIGVFSFSNDYGYTVTEGDEIIIRGEIGQFNGLTQINPDTVWMVSAGNALFDPTVVTALDETTESQLVKIENLTIVDPDDWSNSGSGFNVDVTDGTNTYTMRIDNDVDLYGTDAPTGAFNLTGLGGQFDSSSPFTSGYQLFPRYMADIELIMETDPNYPAYDIGVVTTVDMDGVVDSVGVACQLQGVVYGVNQRPGGLQMTVIDGNNDGIGVFSFSNDYGYTVTEGDEIIIRGEIGQFNGLTQINPDTVWMVSAGNALFDPTVVTALDETTESQLVKIENLTIVDPDDWSNSGSGFNVDVTDGTNTYTMRIDNDVDLYGTDAPTGAFNLTGLGGQFDSSSPFTSGYQLFPRYMADIELIMETDPNYPPYDIGVVTTVDMDGVVDSMDVACQLQGVVYGVNVRPSGLQFTIIDSNNEGIGVFSGSNNYGYTVNEGDEVIIRGEIGQFNGLTQIYTDTVWMVSSGNTLFDATVVTALDEATESQLVKLENLTIVDPGDWTNSGSGFNVDVTDGTNTYTMRIDADVDLYGTPAPTSAFNLTGLGGQFDSSSPYLSGYQIFPRYTADLELITTEGAVKFLGSGVIVNEDVGNVEVAIEYPAGDLVPWEVTVNLGILTSTADEGDDFIWSDTTLMLSGFATDTAYLDIPIIDDMDSEDTETVILVLSSSNAMVDENFDEYTIEIEDNDIFYEIYDIGTVTTVDADGVADFQDDLCQLQGVVYGVNTRPGGLQFTLIDGNNDGINVFNFDNDYGYAVTEGDEIIVQGVIDQYNGLLEIIPDTVWMVSADNALFDPTVVIALGEDTESQLIKIENLTLVDPAQWTNSGSGFNVDVTDGASIFTMRIDNDVDIYGTPAPTQAFNLTGIGGQFDSSSPYTEGYQILPRYLADIDLIDAVNEPDPVATEIFPNPVTDRLVIRTVEVIDGVRVVNALGQEMFFDMNERMMYSLDMSQLPQGIYFVKLQQAGKEWTKPVIKQ